MKKIVAIPLAIILTIVLVLSGCGGVSQEELDDAIAERDAAKAELASVKSDLNKANSQIDDLESELAAAEARIAELEGEAEEEPPPIQPPPEEPPPEEPPPEEPPPEEAVTITWEEAKDHIGETVTVCGPIVESLDIGSAMLLGMGASTTDPSCVGIELSYDILAELPEDLYVGKTICVTGELHTNPVGGASMAVNEASQIVVQ